MLRFVFIVLCLVIVGCPSGVRGDNQGCYSSGNVAGIVIATIVVTLVVAGLAVAFLWYLWKKRKAANADSKSIEKPIMCPPMSPDKQMIARENDYAFDNPYFKDDETENANVDAAEKGEAGFRKDNGDATPVQNAKASNGTTGNHHKKSRPFSSLPFHAVFHPSGKKQQKATTMDDTYISKHLERITVPLRGHDFTGLGFNVCGNMRDGIFVKDVLHRGPASESGKIKAGDRIVGVTVSFAAMVYEDALTILSYASPYDVKLEIEKSPATLSGTHLPSSSPKRLGASTSFRNNGQRQLFHPLYRSQSIDDLTQIGKDGFGVVNNTSGSQRDSSSSATPKRSQSVEASNGGPKTRPAFVLKSEEAKSSSNKGSRKSSTSSCESTAKAVTPTEKSQPVLSEVPCTKKEVKSARFRTEQVNVKTEAPPKVVPPVKPARELHEDKQQTGNDVPDKSPEVIISQTPSNGPSIETKSEATAAENPATSDSEFDLAEKPTAPPRKSSTPKRKAPAPPPTATTKTETSAVVHRAEELQQESAARKTEVKPQENSEIVPPPPPVSDLPPVASETVPEPNELFTSTHEIQLTDNDLPIFSSTEKIATDPGIGSSDTSSLASGDHSSTKMDNDQNASPGKRKASSLGDLTTLERGANKKTSISSAILERAVSLDLQQSIPGENLTKQKKVLRAPAFEDDYLEDREDLTEMNGQGLKRWDNGLDQVFSILPNGEAKSNEGLGNEEDNPSTDPKPDFNHSLDTKPDFHLSSDLKPDFYYSPDKKTDFNHSPEKKTDFNHSPDKETDFNHSSDTDMLDTGLVAESSTEKSAIDLENDSSVEELPLPNLQDSATVLTSTPVKKIIEVKNLPDEDDDILDDVPYLASSKQQNGEESSTKYVAKTNSHSTSTLFSPVTISIPVIKPDLTHFEKLPSPPPASTHPGFEPSWRMNKTITTTEDGGKTSLERISVHSLYTPIFTSKEINSIDEPVLQTSLEKMVNGNESDASEHYSTAQENTSASSLETSSLSVTMSSPVSKEVVIKTPNTIAGFAKTLIIPGPNEVENLLSLAAEPITPPPALEQPSAKPVENE